MGRERLRFSGQTVPELRITRSEPRFPSFDGEGVELAHGRNTVYVAPRTLCER